MTNDIENAGVDAAEFTSMEDSTGSSRIVKSAGVSVLDTILEKGGLLTEPVTSEWVCPRTGVAFPFRALTQSEYEAINKRNTQHNRLKKSNTVHTTVNASDMNRDIISVCCIDPNFRAPEVRNKIANRAGRQGIDTIEDVLELVFLPGELVEFGGAILELSGFLTDEEDTIEDLKG